MNLALGWLRAANGQESFGPKVGFEEIAIDLLRARFWTTFALRAGCSPVSISPLALQASRPNRHLRPQQEM